MKAGRQPYTQVTSAGMNVPPAPLHKGSIRPHGSVQLVKEKIHFLHMQCVTCTIHKVCEDKTYHIIYIQSNKIHKVF